MRGLKDFFSQLGVRVIDVVQCYCVATFRRIPKVRD